MNQTKPPSTRELKRQLKKLQGSFGILHETADLMHAVIETADSLREINPDMISDEELGTMHEQMDQVDKVMGAFGKLEAGTDKAAQTLFGGNLE